MTTEQRFDDVDRRLAALLAVTEANSTQINQLTGSVNALARSVDEMRSTLSERFDHLEHQITGLASETVGWFTGVVEQAAADRAVMTQMQSEVRGLQTENHRILEYLQDQRRGEGSNEN